MERDQSLLDLSNPMVKKYIDFAKDRGYATRGEIALYLPMAATPEEVESALSDGARRRLEDIERRQAIYLTASGTLTQFNAILAAILCAALFTVELMLPLKISVVTALALHVFAAFLLCWAARPIAAPASAAKWQWQRQQMEWELRELRETYKDAQRAFNNYRRGWRMTLLALTATRR